MRRGKSARRALPAIPGQAPDSGLRDESRSEDWTENNEALPLVIAADPVAPENLQARSGGRTRQAGACRQRPDCVAEGWTGHHHRFPMQRADVH